MVLLVLRSQRTLDDTTAQIIIDVLSILFAVILIGGWGLLLKPLHCYEKFLDGLLHGITHVIEDGHFAHLDQEVSQIDGVDCYSLTVTRLDEKQKPYEQLFYFDAQKPLPQLTEGQQLRITYHDRAVGQLEVIG